MSKYAIAIIPSFANVAVIEQIRERYDPMFGKISPHITLVFPFESAMIPEELQDHVETVAKRQTPFCLSVRGITGHDREYLFLNVIAGNDHIVALHRALYTGFLQRFMDIEQTYFPHITVGRMNDRELWRRALERVRRVEEPFNAMVDTLSVLKIDRNGVVSGMAHVQLETTLGQPLRRGA